MSAGNDFWRALCWHNEGWADDGPNIFGDRKCSKCGAEVRVVLTELGFKTDANQMATSFGIGRVFEDID